MKIILCLLLATAACAQSDFTKPLWIGSMATVGAAGSLDIYSSYGHLEGNPFLGSGQFSNGKAAASASIKAGGIGLQLLMCKKVQCTKKDRLIWTGINLGESAFFFWAAHHNFNLR